MIRIAHNNAQAATELAVFGAIIIFIIGTIVRTAVGNSYQQDQDFKAMRMAMLESWEGTKGLDNSNVGFQKPQNTSRDSALILFIQDRLSPDYNKYGDLDRDPVIASGSGTFTYNLLYPLSDAKDITASLPTMDVYINGQYFPFSMASYVSDQAIEAPTNCPYTPGSCKQNQCLRNQREWAGGVLKENSFNTTAVAPVDLTTATGTATTADQRATQMQSNACTIFTDLENAKMFVQSSITGNQCQPNILIKVDPSITLPPNEADQTSSQWTTFVGLYEISFPKNTTIQNKQYLAAILSLLQANHEQYKLFYTLTPNPGGTMASTFTLANPPAECPSHPCKNGELSSDAPLYGYNGEATADGLGQKTNYDGVMQYDLLRNADYSTTTGVLSPLQFPNTGCPNCMRNYVAWQWAATAGTTAAMIGLNTSNNQYPTYDIDGRLKEVTIYSISRDLTGTTHVSYEDSQGGDIDQSWDSNSCGPKPGLMDNSTVYTFTKDGTYLHILEGKLYDPETNTYVRSINQRDSIDLVQRTVQLSNNTGRFCTIECADNSTCNANGKCQDGSTCTPTSRLGCVADDCTDYPSNSVEICEDESAPTSNCFTTATIAQTCYDIALNVLFVRSRLEDRRGSFWMTDTSGQMKVQR